MAEQLPSPCLMLVETIKSWFSRNLEIEFSMLTRAQFNCTEGVIEIKWSKYNKTIIVKKVILLFNVIRKDQIVQTISQSWPLYRPFENCSQLGRSKTRSTRSRCESNTYGKVSTAWLESHHRN